MFCLQVVKHEFHLSKQFQEGVSLKVFACSNNKDAFTTDASMRQVATLELTIKDPSRVISPEDYGIAVSFSFGCTEFRVVGKDQQTGEEVKTDVVFMAD